MEYINSESYTYIMSKYHDATKYFDGYTRFIRRDEYFSEDSGMDGDLIVQKLIENDEKAENPSHAVRKANAFRFVLENTRIECDSRDIFPAINCLDRPLWRSVVGKWKNEAYNQIIPEIEAERRYLESSGIVTIWADYCHSVPFWDRIMSLGFKGILEDCKKRYDELKAKKEPDDYEKNFFESIFITYRAIITLIERLENRAKSVKGSEKLALALGNIKSNPPSDFYEALLVDYIYFICSEHVNGLQARSIANFDRIFYPFYKASLAKGVSEHELKTQLAFFLLQFAAIGNEMGQPVYLGGCNEDESTVINELSFVFLEVFDSLAITTPKIQIKVAQSTPKEFLMKALDMIRHGHNSIVFVSDATIRKALMNAGASAEQARLCDVKGCYEYAVPCAMETGMNYVNLVKSLEYALHMGCDGVTGNKSGLECKSPDEFASFEELYEEYKRQLLHIIETTIRVTNGVEDMLSFVSPEPILSATYPSCLEKVKDVYDGGAAVNSTSMAFGFMADVVDSLTIIKKYVFDKKELTLGELVTMLDANYEGYEKYRLKFFNDRDKYGNNRDIPDGFAVELVKFINGHVTDVPNSSVRGGKWEVSFHVARMSYVQGKKTAASANGRLFGTELSKNLSSCMGCNREGATALVLSVTKIDATEFVGDACIDAALLPSAVKGDDGLEAMYALLQTFVKKGGHAIHLNVFDAETLKKAQQEPEKYKDLQIRVCGWNVLWNNINKVEQDGFIRQAENLAR